MPETPQHVGSRVGWAVNHLNAHWDLGLPRLHGRQARELEKDQSSCATKCFSRIRYLCFRVEIESIMSDFDRRANQLWSKWEFKPSQEKGTLPMLPVTKSFLQRDIQNKRNAAPIKLTPHQRANLLELLFEILNEQFELARMSESFSHERPSISNASYLTAPTTPQKSDASRHHQQIVTPARQKLRTVEPLTRDDEPQLKNPMTGSAKRSIGSPSSVSTNKSRSLILADPIRRRINDSKHSATSPNFTPRAPSMLHPSCPAGSHSPKTQPASTLCTRPERLPFSRLRMMKMRCSAQLIPPCLAFEIGDKRRRNMTGPQRKTIMRR